jgi:hypothetical protein
MSLIVQVSLIFYPVDEKNNQAFHKKYMSPMLFWRVFFQIYKRICLHLANFSLR